MAKRHGTQRSEARIYRGTNALDHQSKARGTPLKQGEVRCNRCYRPTTLKEDGTMRSHRTGPRGQMYNCTGSGSDNYTPGLPS